MMKSLAVVGLLLVTMLGAAQAQMFQTVTPEEAQLQQEGPSKLYCPNCGMNLVKFYKTSHAMEQADGMVHQYCSLHCLVEANERLSSAVQVVDTSSLKFIKASSAFYVVGSSKKGTMTMNSKYAFGARADAEAFAKANGGEIMGFADAVKIARQGLDKENKMINQKRAQAAQKGQTIFTKLADPEKITDLPDFASIAEAKTYVAENEICGTLKDQQYQAVAIYLFTKDTMGQTAVQKIEVPEKEKCPVCGMFVAKYPKWTALVKAADGHKYYFDGVKDMMKFYFKPAKYHVELTKADFARMVVSDYYTLAAIDAQKAWYVAGSNVFGPMGNELIPFKTEKDALVFQEDHFGEKVLSFSEITENLVHSLDQ